MDNEFQSIAVDEGFHLYVRADGKVQDDLVQAGAAAQPGRLRALAERGAPLRAQAGNPPAPTSRDIARYMEELYGARVLRRRG